jgi:type II secretory ATPase GspE/PulE/Tfp pilus assembly ATPase PilB-like protein
MRPMFQDGIAKVCAGITTVEEVLRVTREVE